jgi:two-component system NtrC family sensor kinase
MAVQDNGRGMDKETLQHATEAFYTTKEVGKGTGLGLSLCHSIITEHGGGEIYLESTPDVGTVVRIFLPLLNEQVSKEHIQ